MPGCECFKRSIEWASKRGNSRQLLTLHPTGTRLCPPPQAILVARDAPLRPCQRFAVGEAFAVHREKCRHEAKVSSVNTRACIGSRAFANRCCVELLKNLAGAHGARVPLASEWEARRAHDGVSVSFYEGLRLLDIEVGAPRAPGMELSVNTTACPNQSI